MAGPGPAPGAGPPPLTGGKLGLTAFALALGTFMMVLDTTIANVSLPTIAGNLGVSSDNSTYVVTAFAVANGIGVPLTGFLMGRFGVVRTFCTAVALFTVASFLCGIAWSLPSLIAFRILQGGCSGPMMPGSQALLISIFPPDKRSTALGIWSITTLVAPIMGPILGGYISDNYHWSWIFLINVPVGAFVAFFCWRSLRDRETPTRKLPIDTVGLGLLVLWVGLLQMVLDLGKNADWFNDPTIVVMSVISAIGFLAWVIWELTDANPTVDLTLFKGRNFVLGNIAFSVGYAVFFANTLLLPLLVQGISMSTFFLSMLTITLDGVPPERLPSATGISNFTRIVAGSFAASIITTAWDRREALHQGRLAEAVGSHSAPLDMARAGLARAGLTDVQAVGAISQQLIRQAYLLASTDLFRISAWACAALIVVVWLTRRASPSGAVHAAAD